MQGEEKNLTRSDIREVFEEVIDSPKFNDKIISYTEKAVNETHLAMMEKIAEHSAHKILKSLGLPISEKDDRRIDVLKTGKFIRWGYGWFKWCISFRDNAWRAIATVSVGAVLTTIVLGIKSYFDR